MIFNLYNLALYALAMLIAIVFSLSVAYVWDNIRRTLWGP